MKKDLESHACMGMEQRGRNVDKKEWKDRCGEVRIVELIFGLTASCYALHYWYAGSESEQCNTAYIH